MAKAFDLVLRDGSSMLVTGSARCEKSTIPCCDNGKCYKCNLDTQNEQDFFNENPDMFSNIMGVYFVKNEECVCHYCKKPITYVCIRMIPSDAPRFDRYNFPLYPIQYYHQACMCKFHMEQYMDFFSIKEALDNAKLTDYGKRVKPMP